MNPPHPQAPEAGASLRLLVDLTHTSHTAARTGIQRVTRSLHGALRERAVGICHDPFAGTWRELSRAERGTLGPGRDAAAKRGAQWPLGTRLRGRLETWLGTHRANPVRIPYESLNDGLVVPEIFSPTVAAALPPLLDAVAGPRIAVFYDAIPLLLPDLTPRKTVARYPSYLKELLGFDGVAAISGASRDALLAYWRWLGVASMPPVEAITLGVDPLPAPSAAATRGPSGGLPVVLSVGSIEGRKNHLALLDAAESLWAAGVRFELRLVGLAQAETGAKAMARIAELQAAGRTLRHLGAVRDEAVEQAYAECAFTVYPSLIEGFGLPVIESLARGRPCICSGRGATGESARGGGCVAVDRPDAPSLAGAMRHLLESPADLARLTAEARARRFKTWSDYASELLGWMRTLPRR